MVQVFAVAVNGRNLFAGTLGGAFLSTNNGSSWTPIDSGFTGTYVNVHTFAFIGSNIFAGLYTKGVYLSTNNGTTWGIVNLGLTNLGVTTLAVSGSNLFAGTTGGVFLSTNNGSTWVDVGLTEPTGGIQSLAANNTFLFAGTVGIGGGVWRRPL